MKPRKNAMQGPETEEQEVDVFEYMLDEQLTIDPLDRYEQERQKIFMSMMEL